MTFQLLFWLCFASEGRVIFATFFYTEFAELRRNQKDLWFSETPGKYNLASIYLEIRSEIIQHIDFLKKEAQELKSNVEVIVIHVVWKKWLAKQICIIYWSLYMLAPIS